MFRRNAALGYGFSVTAFLIALGFRFAVDSLLPPGFPFLTFFPAVIISAFIAGSRAGALCFTLSFVAVWYWFLGLEQPFSLTYGAALALGFFTVIAAVDIALVAAAAKSVNLLETQQAQLTTIFETVPLGLALAEFPTGKIIQENRYIEKLFGHALGDSLDLHDCSNWAGFLEDGSLLQAHDYPLAAMILRKEENPNIEVHFQKFQGQKRWLNIVGRPVKDNRGNSIGGVLAFIDIEEQKNSRIALEEALKAKELLLYEVNHRVKNSLHLVNSFLLLESLKIDDQGAQASIMAARAKVDLIARVHQLLYESGTHNCVDLRAAITEIVHDMIASAGRDDISLELFYSQDIAINISQASPLVLVIFEIVTNCLKYGLSSKYPKLIVSVSADTESYTISISDNGPGISSAAMRESSGLGSQIVKGLVHQMRGDYVIQSSDSGVAFILTIPLAT